MIWTILGAIVAVHAAVFLYYRYRPLPPGVNGSPTVFRVPARRVRFLYDISWAEGGDLRYELTIQDAVEDIVRKAERLVLIDVFLFNLQHASADRYLPTTRSLADALADSQARTYFITDPLNTSYGTERSEPIMWLREAGVNLCFTDLRRLRDYSFYSAFWRIFLQWFPTGPGDTVANPLRKGQRTTIRAYLMAANGKGNHRKVIIADKGASHVSMVTSRNFEDASSYFGETAVSVESTALARHLLSAERSVARMSGCDIPETIPASREDGDARVTALMGKHIKRSLLADMGAAGAGDRLHVHMYFLAERETIRSIKEAHRRGVDVRMVLHDNRYSFGQPKHGNPNQSVAWELARSGIEVRFANAQDQELHQKLVVIRKRDAIIVHQGSANLTRRGLSGTVLETNLRVEAPATSEFARDVLAYAERLEEEPCSVPAEPERRLPRYVAYRLQEATGLSTW